MIREKVFIFAPVIRIFKQNKQLQFGFSSKTEASSYTESTEKLSYWRTYTGIEVDAIIGDARIAIEIKSTDEVQTKHKKNLKTFAEEHPNARKIIVSLDKMTREANGIEMIYVLDFFKMLWSGQII